MAAPPGEKPVPCPAVNATANALANRRKTVLAILGYLGSIRFGPRA
jgi:hypothetical protein